MVACGFRYGDSTGDNLVSVCGIVETDKDRAVVFVLVFARDSDGCDFESLGGFDTFLNLCKGERRRTCIYADRVPMIIVLGLPFVVEMCEPLCDCLWDDLIGVLDQYVKSLFVNNGGTDQGLWCWCCRLNWTKCFKDSIGNVSIDLHPIVLKNRWMFGFHKHFVISYRFGRAAARLLWRLAEKGT